MAKVLLVRPKSRIPITNFPLGLMYLAAYLEKEGHSAEIIDLRFPGSPSTVVTQRALDTRPDIVGIGAMTTEDRGLRDVLRQISALPYKPTVAVGGPHVNAYSREIMGYNGVDCAVFHEGEQIISEIAQGRGLDEIRGTAYRRNGGYAVNPERDFIANLDTLPYPAYHLLNVERYFKNPFVHGFALARNRHAQIMSSRGCPYGCIFCHNIFGKRFRARSPENVFGEIKLIYERYRVREIHFEDDSFNLDRKRAEKIFDLIIQSGFDLKISFPNGLRADILDREMIQKMKRAGVYQVSVGIESADTEIQKKTGKGIDLDKVTSAVNELASHGILTDGFFMLGFLNESRSQMMRTIRFARNSPLHLATIHKVNPFPQTPLGRQAEEKGFSVQIDDVGEDGYRFGKVNISALSQAELDKMQKMAYLCFYTKLSRLWKIFRLVPNKMTLFSHFLRLIFWR